MKKSSFAQVSKTAVKQLVSTLEVVARASVVSQVDQEKLSAFIQAAEDDGDDFLSASAPDAKAYESQSGSILDVLEDMKEKAMALKNDAEKAEMKSQHSFEMLAQSIKGELAADKKELNAAKTTKAASSEVKATAEADLGMTEKMLAEAKTYLGDLSQDCQTKAADWEVSQKARAEELQALSDALKIIKEKTGGATSRAYDFFEVKAKSKELTAVGKNVLDTLRKLAKAGGNADVALSQLSLQVQTAFEMSSGAEVFGKVKSMITEMIDKLVAEAAEEAEHKAWCDKEMSEAQEKIAA